MSSISPSIATDRLIPINELEKLAGIKRGAIYNRVRAGEMPAPVRLSHRCSRWKLSQVSAWIDAQTQEVPA